MHARVCTLRVRAVCSLGCVQVPRPSRCSKKSNDSPSKVSWRTVLRVSIALLTCAQSVLHHLGFAGGDTLGGREPSWSRADSHPAGG